MGSRCSSSSHRDEELQDMTNHLPSVQQLTAIPMGQNQTSEDHGQMSSARSQISATSSSRSVSGRVRVRERKQNALFTESVVVQVGERLMPEIPPPAPTLTPSEDLIVRALFPFQAVNCDDLSFNKGDRMKVDTSTTNLDWWLAEHLRTGARGYIPNNYVCVDDTLQAQDWWFDADRKEADLLLLLPGNRDGTFLVRSAHDKVSHVLSIRHESRQGSEPTVKHYRIRTQDNGIVFVNHKKRFHDIPSLIQYYSRPGPNCLRVTLTQPCPRLRPCETGRIQDLEIDRSAITLDYNVGAGHFGEVWKGTLYKSAEVAVKTLKAGSMSPEDFLSEAKMMHRMRHRNLVRLLAVCSREEPIWIVTEFMTNGSLLSYLRKDEARYQLSFPSMLKMAAQIADGMQYLEAQNFVHRDLRAANILVGEYYDVKVADFGLARVLDENAIYMSRKGCKFPVKWTAPEAALHREFSVKSDVWSYGIVLYELVTFGREPYPGFGPSEVLKVIRNGYRMPQPKQDGVCCPDAVYDMMLKCWHHVPSIRPTFEFLQTFFENYEVSSEGSYLEEIA